MTAPTTLDPDPFATPEDVRQTRADSIITAGRYRLPNRDGSHKARGWQRATNLVSAISDQRQLQDWTVRTTLAGLGIRPDLVTELSALIAEVGTDREAIKAAQARILDIAERAKDAAGGGHGRDRGNRVHAIVEADWAGIPVALHGREPELLRLFGRRLAEAQLVPIPGMQERIILCESLEACGKFDSLAHDAVSDVVRVVDTKTQRVFWSWLEVEAQLAVYANADAMWDPGAAAWVDMPHEVDRGLGAALWVPEQGPDAPLAVEIKPLDLVRGWETAQLARRVVVQRSACKSAKQAVSGRTWAEARPTLTERYARLFASVATVSEGAALVRECKARGVWNPVTREAAQVAANRLTSLIGRVE